jgi:hypothetical protein
MTKLGYENRDAYFQEELDSLKVNMARIASLLE